MVVKTITVTENAYNALKSLKGEHESFSDTILRVSNKRSLKDFVGILSEESGERIEKYIRERRARNFEARKKRIARIVEELGGKA